jgi:hypothetical protein
MATQKQIEANRKNAQFSTGPRTPEGKETASQNALTHGLTAHTAVIEGESPEEFDTHRTEMLDHLRPSGPIESMFAHRIVVLSWQLQRAAIIQTATLTDRLQRHSDISDPHRRLGRAVVSDFAQCRTIDRIQMYEIRIQNALHKAIQHLHTLQTLRRRESTALEKTNPIPPIHSRPPQKTGKTPTGTFCRRQVVPVPAFQNEPDLTAPDVIEKTNPIIASPPPHRDPPAVCY